MSYNELIGVVRETNRTPGGAKSIHAVLSRCLLPSNASVLDIGTSTGSTAIEIGQLLGCRVVGIDLNTTSLDEARRRVRTAGLVGIEFVEADAINLPFADGTFDLVFCGNVTTLVSDRQRALNEYTRVLRAGGYLAAIPMYYRSEPPAALVDAVRAAIQVDIDVSYAEDAIATYLDPDLEVLDRINFAFDDIPQEQVAAFCRDLLNRPHLEALAEDARVALEKRYSAFMRLFRDNLALMGFTVLISRKSQLHEDPELFTAHLVV